MTITWFWHRYSRHATGQIVVLSGRRVRTELTVVYLGLGRLNLRLKLTLLGSLLAYLGTSFTLLQPKCVLIIWINLQPG